MRTGDRCWEDQRCHNRRSYYRHRGVRNHHRKQKRRGEQGTAETGATAILDIPVPAVPAAVIHWYRETKDAPLHALGAELWMGNDRVAKIESVHCLGLTELQVKTVLLRILDGFSQHVMDESRTVPFQRGIASAELSDSSLSIIA